MQGWKRIEDVLRLWKGGVKRIGNRYEERGVIEKDIREEG